jgi:hypothetical protein
MKNKLLAILWLSGLMLAAAAADDLRAAKYPPGLRWREISRGPYTVIFPAGRAAEAEKALAAAEALHAKLLAFWRFQPIGRTRIVLSDSSDQPNGFATYFPFNIVEADLPESPPDSELAASRGWLDLVLAHEMTHVFTLNAGSGLFRALHAVFGNLPLLYAATQLPPWVIEGLAVEGESTLTGDGRLDHPPYRLMLDAARRDGTFPAWSRLAGMPAAWPGPEAKYLFGAGFMEFLAEKYGRDSLRRYLERVADQLILFSSSRDFRRTFGEPLGKLWKEFAGGRGPAAAAAPLTARGFHHLYPCPAVLAGEKKLLYYRRDYRDRGAVAMLDLRDGKERKLFEMDAVNGLSYATGEDRIYLSAVDSYHAFSELSDLYRFDLRSGRLERLSRGQRLSQPLKKANAEEVYCVQRSGGGYRLALFDLGKRSTRVLSRVFPGMAQPAASPDGSMVAVALKPEGGPWGIGLFSDAGEPGIFISAPGADLSQPRWHNPRTLLFIQSAKASSRLASISLEGNGGGTCDDARLAGMRQFALSSGGDGEREIFFTYFSGRGVEIARLPVGGLPFSPSRTIVVANVPEAPAAAAPAPSRPYRFWRDLLPRWWSPSLRQGGDEVQPGAMTGGQDALGIHSYSLEGYYGLSSRQANGIFQYVYDGLFPTLSLTYRDISDYRSAAGYSKRLRELTLASLWPLRIRRRSQLYAYADLHGQRRRTIFASGSFPYPGSFNGGRLGFYFNSAREYYDSVSPADGVLFTLKGSLHPSGLGNERASRSVQAELRHYVSLFRPGVLAWRLAAAWSRGDSYYYDMGGAEGEAASGLADEHPFDLVRGFPAGYWQGDKGWQFNLEYRLPLFRIEKAVLPAVSVDRAYVNAFLDMGRLWQGKYPFRILYSVGGEGVLRLAFGGAAAYDLAMGAAYGFGPESQYRVYVRMGRSF